jgi:hypothetical protein
MFWQVAGMDATRTSRGAREKPSHNRPFLIPSRGDHVFDHLPPVPILLETRLRLDLLLGRPTIDVSTITETILSDLGATLQVFRATTWDRAPSQGTEFRVEDCVVHLGRKSLCRNLRMTLPHNRGNEAKRLWQQARLAAEISSLLAARRDDVRAEDAYLAGLLHEIGCLPAILGWSVRGVNLNDSYAVCGMLTDEWRLPAFVHPRFGGTAPFVALQGIVRKAWHITKNTTDYRPMETHSNACSTSSDLWKRRSALPLPDGIALRRVQ